MTIVMLSAVLATLLVGLSAQPLLIRWLRRRGVMDTPNHRSSHVSETPRGGGIGVVVSMCAGFTAYGVSRSGPLPAFLVVLLGMATLGLADDLFGLPSLVRLGVQICVGTLGVLMLGSPNWIGLILVLWIAAYTNAFNFMDGANGLSGFNALFVGLVYAVASGHYAQPGQTAAALVLAAGAAAFLPWNVPRARVFLGDVGSYAQGGFIAILATSLARSGVPLVIVLAPLSVYLADTTTTLIQRARLGEPLLEAHRSHTYQKAIVCGMSHTAVSLTTVAFAALVTGAAWLAVSVHSALAISFSICTAAIALGGYLALPAVVRRRGAVT